MERMDVLFVVPRAMETYQSLAVQRVIEPPAMTRLMAAYLMSRNCGVAVFDANIHTLSSEMIVEDVVEHMRPHLVVVPVYGYNPSSSTQTMPAARAFAKTMKDFRSAIPILFTGTHPSALPERTLREEPIDFVCDGEGPITVYELLQVLKSGDSLGKVRDLWYWDNGAVAHNAAAPHLNLSDEPASPAWIHMDPRAYYAHDWHSFYADYEDRTPYANPFSTQGCPFDCDFCNIQSPFRSGESLTQIGEAPAPNSYRRLKPELFVEEVARLVEHYGVKHFKIPDEMFTLHSGHVLGIARGIRERFGDSLNFWCYARVDTCKPEFLEPMRAAGIKWICLGIEAANSKVRSGQDKGFSDESVYNVVNRLRDAGISGALNYIFGLPQETPESMQATYDLAVALDGPFVNLYSAMALPGSKLHRQATASGYPLPERAGGPGWAGYSQYGYESEPYYVGEALTPAQVLQFRDVAFKKYYSRPEYQAALRSDPNFGEVAVKNIKCILDRPPLRRKLLE